MNSDVKSGFLLMCQIKIKSLELFPLKVIPFTLNTMHHGQKADPLFSGGCKLNAALCNVTTLYESAR